MTIIEPRILKGTREFGPEAMAMRNHVLDKITQVFLRHGYSPIETPILHPAETILGKYGDEGDHLTYQFTDNGGRKLALPYDLTVPFARYFAANWQTLPLPFKRYQIQRVWRAEKPQKGRLREFYQCDIDIIGTDSLLAEAEMVRVMTTVLCSLGFDNFHVKINSRRLMNAILTRFAVTDEQMMPVIRIIDKLAKIGQDKVIALLHDLGIKDAVALMQLMTPEDTAQDTLKKLADYDSSDIQELLAYCDALSIPQQHICFDPTLARGLDYYTGVIFELESLDHPDLGALCAGGRYDNLCGLFCKEHFSGVGVAFGFERLVLALEEKGALTSLAKDKKTLVTVFDDTMKHESLALYHMLTEAGVHAELYLGNERLKKQLRYADRKDINFVVIYGPEEKEHDVVTVKSMYVGKQKTIPMSQLVSFLQSYMYSGEKS